MSGIDVLIEPLDTSPGAPLDDEANFEGTFKDLPGIIAVSALLSPKKLLLGFLRDGRLRVYSPISVNISKEEGNFIAEATELDEFGFGKNASEAITDLQRAIAELYLTLEAEQDKLGADLVRVWDILQKKISRQ